MVDIEELRKQHLETQFDQKEFVLSADNLITAARASGETREEFLDPDNENFQATPAFLCSLASGSTLPIDFPSLGGIPMDGGKAVEIKAPVQPDIKRRVEHSNNLGVKNPSQRWKEAASQ